MIIENVVKNGIGVMPAFEGMLSSEEIEAVAHYVSIAANNQFSGAPIEFSNNEFFVTQCFSACQPTVSNS